MAVAAVAVSCSKDDGKEKPLEGEGQLTVFKNQTDDPEADALQAQYIGDGNAYTLNFYGLFNENNEPVDVNTITYQKTGSDSIVNLVLDPITKRLASSFVTVNGTKSPIVMKYDYFADAPNAMAVSYYNHDWNGGSSDLLYTVRLERNGDQVNQIPVFAARSAASAADWLIAVGTGIGVAEIVAAVSGGWSGLSALGTVSAGLVAGVSASGLVTAAAVGATIFALSAILNESNASELTPADIPYPQNTPVGNPATGSNNPGPGLPASDCLGTTITFTASMDSEGSILIAGVNGGQAPYTYIVNSVMQQSQIFGNNYPNGSYTVGVKDANGCISMRIVTLSRELEGCENSTLAVTVAVDGADATATASGGQPPYTYSWSSGSTGISVDGLPAGGYSVTVTDSMGCTSQYDFTIGEVSGCGTITDVDGNTYNTVIIGGQCWMQENLNVSHYRNGDVIPQVQDPEAWANLTTGAWCYYENNTANGVVYGKLYNWYAVADPRGLAPEGWHIPNDAEWTTLTNSLGGEAVAGGAIKSVDNLWIAGNVGATNSSGFTGLPGGGGEPFGGFQGLGMGAYWWSSTPEDAEMAWYRMVRGSQASVSRYNGYKLLSMSVRCVKN